MQLSFASSRSLPLPIACAALLASASSAQSVIRTLDGAFGERFGAAVAAAGDVNGDGWLDYLVGIPEAGTGGGVRCVSGKYLATGLAPTTLYSYVAPMGVLNGSRFGWSLAALGDIDGDGSTDFAVGAPNFDSSTLSDCGAVFLFHGTTHVPSSHGVDGATDGSLLGWSLSAAGDMNGDGLVDVVSGAPGVAGEARLISGGALQFGGSQAVIRNFPALFPGTYWGESVLGGVDFDLDGIGDVVVCAPYAQLPGHNDQGLVRVMSGGFNFPVIAEYWGGDTNALGRELAGGADFDADGYPDLVVSSFSGDNGSAVAKVLALSVERIHALTPPYEIHVWNGPSQLFGSANFGASLAIAPDVSGDGRADVLVGMPTYTPTFQGTGGVRIYSGTTGARIGARIGAPNQFLGTSMLSCGQDLDADGVSDFLAGSLLADTAGTDCGVLVALKLFPAAPNKYCVGKLNSLGCTPSFTYSGTASATSTAAFTLGALNVINHKNGLLFYGRAPQAAPFQGGLICVAPPTIRTPVQDSGGNPSGNDCSGSFHFDFNAHVQSGVDPALLAGAEAFCQYWSRDPASPSTTSLSDALEFVIGP